MATVILPVLRSDPVCSRIKSGSVEFTSHSSSALPFHWSRQLRPSFLWADTAFRIENPRACIRRTEPEKDTSVPGLTNARWTQSCWRPSRTRIQPCPIYWTKSYFFLNVGPKIHVFNWYRCWCHCASLIKCKTCPYSILIARVVLISSSLGVINEYI